MAAGRSGLIQLGAELLGLELGLPGILLGLLHGLQKPVGVASCTTPYESAQQQQVQAALDPSTDCALAGRPSKPA